MTAGVRGPDLYRRFQTQPSSGISYSTFSQPLREVWGLPILYSRETEAQERATQLEEVGRIGSQALLLPDPGVLCVFFTVLSMGLAHGGCLVSL